MVGDQCLSHKGLASPKPYDERLLVLQWPPSVSNTQMSNYKFTVHGLWFNMGSHPVCCTLSNAGITLQISGFLWKDMVKHWPNLICPNYPEIFWLREYATHGSCVTGFQDQGKYFGTALAILKGIGEVRKMLLSSGRLLERGKLYNVTEFEHVTIGGKQFFPSLRCVWIRGSHLLREIVFCTDMKNNQIRCTNSVQTCDRNRLFIFP
ncbi:hypothetical protein RGQ29_013944 [Quercus rubra]|uniref:Uncharacterized protein n=1 Tax=Quercus rubra TaxID=3512 RepID=A0AAN7J2H7_QUERU|nr:hypothetical protein RGQ29_013944 [Quercus rubra]